MVNTCCRRKLSSPNSTLSLIALSLQGNDTVIVKFLGSSNTLRVSRSALCSVSRTFANEHSTKDIWQLQETSRTALKLFLQWLYTDRYHEYDCYAPGFHNETEHYSLKQEPENAGNDIAWRVKAALLAYEFGRAMGILKFQNYAMARLFQAYRVDEPKVQLCPAMYKWVKPRAPSIAMFFDDVIIRNWGDTRVINHELVEWPEELLESNSSFSKEFMKAVGVPVQRRQQEPMVLEKYLVDEEYVKEEEDLGEFEVLDEEEDYRFYW
jgi:hypothetical protein